MKQFFLLLLVVVLTSSCGASRRVSRYENLSWVGHPTLEILQAMGNPESIDDDGKGGSILRYTVKSNYESPSYDILDPATKPVEGGYADFYVDREGDCYQVDSNIKLPNPSYGDYVYEEKDVRNSIWVDLLVSLPLLLIGVLL